MTSDIPVNPVQVRPDLHRQEKRAVAPQAVTLRAYEVYSHVHRPQEALITGECRGGFSAAELVAFLYARSFPKAEWGDRVDEALRGMTL